MLQCMFSILFMIMCLTQFQMALAAGDPNDSQGSKDPALFSRMPGFHIYRSEVREFDRYEFPVGPDKKEKVEGYHSFVIYYANEGITLPSGLQVTRNYVNAARAIGGDQVYEYEDGGMIYSIIKIANQKNEIWAEVMAAGNDQYTIHVIEKQLMKQDVAVNADTLASGIKETGRVAVYGIYFDTNKADLKTESEPALAEIVKMLKADAGLKVYVVGHTDNVGHFANNVKLSQDRATAVIAALVSKHGIAASRLTPFGVGPTAPVASNKNDEGRAKKPPGGAGGSVAMSGSQTKDYHFQLPPNIDSPEHEEFNWATQNIFHLSKMLALHKETIMKAIELSTCFITKDVDACREFYQRYFSAQTVFDCGWYVNLRMGGHGPSIQFMEPQGGMPTFNGTGIMLNFKVEDVDSEHTMLTGAGLQTAMLLEDHPWGDRGFSVIDPIGNSVYVYSDREPSDEFKQYYKG